MASKKYQNFSRKGVSKKGGRSIFMLLKKSILM